MTQSVTVNEDSNNNVITLSGSDIEGDTLTYTIETAPANGTLSGTAPNLSYTPNTNYSGSDSFTFSISDGTSSSNIATVSITVTNINDAPIANDQSVTVDEDSNNNVITLNGSDIEGDTLTYTVETAPANGTLGGTVPNLSYTPNTNYTGTDSFTFSINDGTTNSNTATISITIDNINDAPTAIAQTISVDEDSNNNVITLSGSDIEGDTLTYTIETAPANGTLSGTAPNLSYTPNANYSGSDSFTFSVSDGTATSNTATISITIDNINDAPIATAQTISVNEDSNNNVITLSGSDIDGDTLSYTIESNPNNGTLSGTVPNLSYTPNANYTGTDSFTFSINDGTATSNIATVSITVININDAPKAIDQSITINEDSSNNVITLSGSDLDGDTLSYTVETTPGNGTLSGTAPNLSYTPNANYTGTDSFTFSINDGTATSNITTISITINNINDAPTAIAQSIDIKGGSSNPVTLTGSDIDGDSLSYTIESNPNNGTLSGTAPNLSYTPFAHYEGFDSFTFSVSDGTSTSPPVTVSLNIAFTLLDRNDPLLAPYQHCAGYIEKTGLDVNGNSVLDDDEVTSETNVFSNGTPITRNELDIMIAADNDVSHVNICTISDMSSLFLNNGGFNQDISQWNTANVTTMSSMFQGASSFNQDISQWDTTNVTTMNYMFSYASSFNQDISQWNTANVTTMNSMFFYASSFNQDISQWNTANVTTMRGMFNGTSSFNQDISQWNTANVTSMRYMFSSANSFNQDISQWNTANVTDMGGMFSSASSFNQDISQWDTANVTNMSWMFSYASNFNQDISQWDTMNVTTMSSMFQGANSFNQDISQWDTANVTDMSSMFRFASSFNQGLSGWNVSSVVSYAGFDFGSALTPDNVPLF